MYSETLKQIQTVDDKNDILISINNLLLALDQHGLKVEQLVDKFFSLRVARSFNQDQLIADPKNYFQNLVKSIEDLETLSLEVAIEPTAEMMQKIYSWVIESLGRHVIIDLSVNPSLIAGAKISFNGKYLDCSLEKSLNVWRHNSNVNKN